MEDTILSNCRTSYKTGILSSLKVFLPYNSFPDKSNHEELAGIEKK